MVQDGAGRVAKTGWDAWLGNAVKMSEMAGQIIKAAEVPRRPMSVWQLAKILLRTIWRAIRQLFHEITGAFFATFALSGGISIWRQYQNQTVRVPVLIGLTALFTVLMAVFSWMAFRSARNVR